MQVTPEELGRLAGMMQPRFSPSPYARLETLYAQASAKRIAPALPLNAIKVSVAAETVAAFQAPTRDDRFAAAREQLGMPTDHPNVLYVDVLLTHSNTVMQNEGRDFIPTDVLVGAKDSLMWQPFDVATDSWGAYWGEVDPTFDRHMRQRNGDDNGICGFVYATSVVEPEGSDQAELWAGVVFWPRDFPQVCEKMVENRDALGASFDLVFSQYDQTADRRIIKDPTFYGGTILYRNRAGDNKTEVGSTIYAGQEVGPDVEGTASAGASIASPAASAAASGDSSMKTDTANAAAGTAHADSPPVTEANALAEATTQLANLTATLTATTASLEAEKVAHAGLKDELGTVKAERDKLQAELDEIKSAAEKARLTDERMKSLAQIGTFETETAETEARAKVGAMAEIDFAMFSARHQIGVLTRQLAAAQAAQSQAREANAGVAIVHNTGQPEENPNSNVNTGPGIVHNGAGSETGGTGQQTSASDGTSSERSGDSVEIETSASAAPQTGSLSSIAAGAAITTTEALSLRAKGAKLREAMKVGK